MSMRVYLDNEPISVERPTLRSAFGAAIESASGRGRVIIEVLADGNPVAGELLADPPDEPIDGEELRFTSVEPWSMVHEIMHEAAEALDVACEHQRRASERILDGELDDAREHVELAISIWQQVVLALQRSGELLELDVERLEVGEPAQSIGERVRGLAGLLQELSRGAEGGDWSGLSDLLAFDLQEQAGIWKEALFSLARALRDEHAGAS